MSSRISDKELVIGVDVGGTKVAVGIVNVHGKILAHLRAPMNCKNGAEAGLTSVLSAIESLFKQDPSNRAKIHRIGICAGIILDGKILHGRTGSAAEGGHVSIDFNGPVCNCGKKGCIEILASGTAIARRTRERLAQSPELGAQIMELAAGDPFAIRSEMIGKAAQSNDPLAKEILEQTLEYLAIWLGNTVDLLE